MNPNETESLTKFINTDEYPILEPDSQGWTDAVDRIRNDLERDGCSVLSNFIRSDVIPRLQQEGVSVAHQAYKKLEIVNAYNTTIENDMAEDHPARITFEKGNGFVAKDQIPYNAIIQKLYAHPNFKTFIAECFEMDEIFELEDPLAALCLNVLEEGRSHPWHFDVNEFTVSLLTQVPEGGGLFEYCPNIRTPEAENLGDVRDVLTGNGEQFIKRIYLKPGDLQFFKGRYALHRVSEVEGKTERHTAIFAYSGVPGVIGGPERTRQLFGRVLPKHIAAYEQAVRSDGLLD